MSKEYKAILLGGGGVGKSTFCIRLIQDWFVDEYDPTIEDEYRKQFAFPGSGPLGGKVCLVSIMDTAGQEEFSCMRDHYVRFQEIFIFMMDVRRRDSFEELADELQRVQRTLDEDVADLVAPNGGRSASFVLVVTKCDHRDREEERQVSDDEIHEWARTNHFSGVVETSAKCETGMQNNCWAALELGILAFEAAEGSVGSVSPSELRQRIRRTSSLAPWNWPKLARWNKQLKRMNARRPTLATLAGAADASYGGKKVQLKPEHEQRLRDSIPKSEVQLRRERALDPLDALASDVFHDLAEVLAEVNPSMEVARGRTAYSGAHAPGAVVRFFGDSDDRAATHHDAPPDAVVVVGSTCIWCHRVVLALRSGYFRRRLGLAPSDKDGKAPSGAAAAAAAALSGSKGIGAAKACAPDVVAAAWAATAPGQRGDALPENISFVADLSDAHGEATPDMVAQMVRLIYDPYVRSKTTLATLISLRALNEELLEVSGAAGALDRALQSVTEAVKREEDAREAQGKVALTKEERKHRMLMGAEAYAAYQAAEAPPPAIQTTGLAATQAVFTSSAAIRTEMAPALADLEDLADVRVDVTCTADIPERKQKEGDVISFLVHRSVVAARSRWLARLIADAAAAGATSTSTTAPASPLSSPATTEGKGKGGKASKSSKDASKSKKKQKGGKMEEGERSFIVVTVDPETMGAEAFESVLHYMLTGRLPDEMSTSPHLYANQLMDLLAVSNLLQMGRLLQLCEISLDELVDVVSVVSLHLAASFYSADRLRERCEHFLMRHWGEIEALEAAGKKKRGSLTSSSNGKSKNQKSSKKKAGKDKPALPEDDGDDDDDDDVDTGFSKDKSGSSASAAASGSGASGADSSSSDKDEDEEEQEGGDAGSDSGSSSDLEEDQVGNRLRELDPAAAKRCRAAWEEYDAALKARARKGDEKVKEVQSMKVGEFIHIPYDGDAINPSFAAVPWRI